MNNVKKYSLFILVCAIFGNTFLAISLGLKAGASPLLYGGIRFTAAGFIMIMVMLLTGKVSIQQLKSLCLRSAFLSLFLVVGTFGLMFIAQTKVDSGFMARLDATGPIFTALFASLFLHKRLNPYHYIALLLGTMGSFLIAAPSSATHPIMYLIAAWGCVILYAVGNVLYPLLFKKEESAVTINALQSLIGGLLLLGLSYIAGQTAFPAKAILPLLYLIIAGSIIAHTAVMVLVKEAGPLFASGWLYVAPIIATLSGYIILKESISFLEMGGTILALIGTFLLGVGENKSAQKQKTGTKK
ncbi:DMT family transporter [Spirochaeta cellobiosiphila]|uniref:DMT family transporter n=1 Tax=Spirochaeta cellobiosiphila TaxID=504483 RepID=UPI00041D4629|nr:EamA family transporter [Spirochaeta cellobiosiphila]